VATRALFRAEDIERLQSMTGRKYELVRGELFEVVTGYRHGRIQAQLIFLLQDWSYQTRLGVIVSEMGYTLERDPDTVRGPDVSFIPKERIPPGGWKRGFPELAPYVAFEVRSPNDTWRELLNKAKEYLDHGCQMVVLVEADEFIEIHRPGREPRRLGLDEVFDGEEVLPGFSCRVGDFFPEEFA